MQNNVIMFNKWILGLLLFFSLSSEAFGLSCPQSMSVKDIAKLVIERELRGIRVESMENSTCLQQNKFPYLKIAPDYGDDTSTEPQAFIDKGTKIENLKIKLVDKDTFLYQANYSLKSGKKVIQDRVKFFLYKDALNQKEFGCAGVIDAPKMRTVYRYCLKKSSK